MSSQMPWDVLRAETVRSICRDIGLHATGRREEMITYLKEVERDGLDTVKNKLAEMPAKRKSVGQESRAKRARKAQPAGAAVEEVSAGKRQTRSRRAPSKRAASHSKGIFEGVVLPATSKGRAPSKSTPDPAMQPDVEVGAAGEKADDVDPGEEPADAESSS
ncbi:hypothetical protein BKA93DRAFT_755003 [Sparassis latifolia]|uniref:SAP domain-containing protein n=1 Tax=Sparassis crispa TaxID=139825 RepID=A0A401GTR2_9APHY|nr:hypothetical protein SCP_0801400 [Sparassis crispa]GBE85621.1 hypothetical protein SCP_0801400 [Sparassis crispa]